MRTMLKGIPVFILLISLLNAASLPDASSELVNALVNGISNNNNALQQTENVHSSDVLTAEEANTITVIMNTLLPSMFGLFSNITSDDYKANFKAPCEFEVLLDLFKQLPPYFDVIAQKYPSQPDLIAYYSMQLASTFLVNNGSLTMDCMYNMLSLQTRLNTFSLDIMDNPEKNPKLVGLFGIFMKPIMKMLKKNAMMKIIEHVDQYDKNDDRENITIFHILNFLFIVFGIIGILSNILLIILIRRSSVATKYSNQPKKSKSKYKLMDKDVLEKLPLHNTHSLKLNRNLKGHMEHTIMISSIDRKLTRSSHIDSSMTKTSLIVEQASRNKQRLNESARNTMRKNKKPLTALQKKQHKLIEEYKSIKASNSQMYYYTRKRYKTRICIVLIAICHSLYILINFIIMSQAALAAVSLKGLSQFNVACKFAFFLFPPTTAYNILHQFAIWLLVYAIRQHGRKLRKTRTFDMNSHADHDIDLFNSDSESSGFNVYSKPGQGMYESSANEDDEGDTVSVSLTNNSNNLTISQSGVPSAINGNIYQQNSAVKFKSNQSINNNSNNYHQILTHQRNQPLAITVPSTPAPFTTRQSQYKAKKVPSDSCFCELFSRKRKNVMFCVVLLTLLCAYDAQNLFLYSLANLEGKTDTVYFCAFESTYAEYYSVLTQLIVPLTNLCLFSLFPILLCTMQVLFDACFLVRVKREQMKRYEKLKEVIEWPLYAYFAVLIISQVPFALHQVVDLCIGTVKFPFVFPLFIQLKFTSKVWLSVFEMVSMFLACAADFYIWILCDRQFRTLASNWINKRIFCRTYKQKKAVAAGKNDKIKEANSPSTHSSNNSRTSEVDSSSTSSSYSSTNRSNDSLKNTKQQKHIYMKTQKQHVNNLQSAPANSYTESLMSSNDSTHKKPISPIVAAAADTAAATAKAAAAISASMGQPSIYDNFNTSNLKKSMTPDDLSKSLQSPTYSSDTMPASATPLDTSQTNARIKMIDTDIDDIEDMDIDHIGQSEPLPKLYEDKNHEIAIPNEQPPPSFNTAMRKDKGESNSYRHQYQNTMDLEALVQR